MCPQGTGAHALSKTLTAAMAGTCCAPASTPSTTPAILHIFLDFERSGVGSRRILLCCPSGPSIPLAFATCQPSPPGDTAISSGLREIGRRLSPDLALLPIGAYNPPSFRNVHASPADATRAFLDLNARWMVPMHYGTFRLSHEPMDEPLQLLEKE